MLPRFVLRPYRMADGEAPALQAPQRSSVCCGLLADGAGSGAATSLPSASVFQFIASASLGEAKKAKSVVTPDALHVLSLRLVLL